MKSLVNMRSRKKLFKPSSFRHSSPLLLLLAISISFCSALPRLITPRAVENEGVGQNERRTVLRRKVVVNKEEAGNKIEQMSNKTRLPELGAALKEEEILLGDNLKTNPENRNSTTTTAAAGVTNTTAGVSSPFTSLFLGFPSLPDLSELPLGMGWVAGVFDSLLPTVRHTQMPPHILL